MRSSQSNYTLDRSKWRNLTPFEADLSRYLHMTDCKALEKVWQPYWDFCPQCHQRVDVEGVVTHRPKSEVAC